MIFILSAGFRLKELVIKRQHNCKTTGFWYENSIRYNFLLLAHEYLLIFEKPANNTPLVKEDKLELKKISYNNIKRISLKRKIGKYETTIVWILDKKKFGRAVVSKFNKKVYKG